MSKLFRDVGSRSFSPAESKLNTMVQNFLSAPAVWSRRAAAAAAAASGDSAPSRPDAAEQDCSQLSSLGGGLERLSLLMMQYLPQGVCSSVATLVSSHICLGCCVLANLLHHSRYATGALTGPARFKKKKKKKRISQLGCGINRQLETLCVFDWHCINFDPLAFHRAQSSQQRSAYFIISNLASAQLAVKLGLSLFRWRFTRPDFMNR